MIRINLQQIERLVNMIGDDYDTNIMIQDAQPDVKHEKRWLYAWYEDYLDEGYEDLGMEND
jgi:hypothetical protein